MSSIKNIKEVRKVLKKVAEIESPNCKSFSMSEKETTIYKQWAEEHDKVCKLKLNNEDRSMTFSFTPTGIADGITVKCSCGESKDVTDYGSW